MARKRLSLEGNIYGYLTVIACDAVDNTKNTYWLCRCICGSVVSVRGQHLISGNTSSCGCQKYKNRKPKYEDLTGYQYGRLFVISYEGNDNNLNPVWLCQCSCGKLVKVRAFSLKNSSQVSCGCYMREKLSKLNRTHGLSKTPEYNRQQTRKHRELKRKLDTSWTVEMERLLLEKQTKCCLCGNIHGLEVDHLNPLSKGYGLQPGNAVVLCRHCNASKGNKILSDLNYKDISKLLNSANSFYFDCIISGLWLNS